MNQDQERALIERAAIVATCGCAAAVLVLAGALIAVAAALRGLW